MTKEEKKREFNLKRAEWHKLKRSYQRKMRNKYNTPFQNIFNIVGFAAKQAVILSELSTIISIKET